METKRARSERAPGTAASASVAKLLTRACRRSGPGSRAAGVVMAFKLIEAAQTRWRMVNGPHLVALVRAEPASSTANSSNDPTTKINKEVINKRREARRSTGLDYSSETAIIRRNARRTFAALSSVPIWVENTRS
jgi:hypothetical protein